MLTPGTGELVWIRSGGNVRLVVHNPNGIRGRSEHHNSVRVSNLTLPLVRELPKGVVLYRSPISLQTIQGELTGGPVFAILAGNRHFTGSRADFRDILWTGMEQSTFVFVLPTACVSNGRIWSGYVRVGSHKWIEVPCPRPEAIYNRIPNRALERTKDALRAKSTILRLGIPMFNPDYFNKAEIYQVVRKAGLARYLPETREGCNKRDLEAMLLRRNGVYLKPAGGSIGHGILRVDKHRAGWTVRVLKNTNCKEYHVETLERVWNVVNQQRLRGQYVMQAAVERILWQGRPCDFRILAQKIDGLWQVVGKGVRVAGSSGITTHVPNGGSIASCDEVLDEVFGKGAEAVDQGLSDMVIRCAGAIDGRYDGKLGEMSMDIGVDREGGLWLFEANSKPMKFDEKDIRSRSLNGIIHHLRELRNGL